jgi:hypothetical protein
MERGNVARGSSCAMGHSLVMSRWFRAPMLRLDGHHGKSVLYGARGYRQRLVPVSH